jgi:hypothetical protein
VVRLQLEDLGLPLMVIAEVDALLDLIGRSLGVSPHLCGAELEADTPPLVEARRPA